MKLYNGLFIPGDRVPLLGLAMDWTIVAIVVGGVLVVLFA